MRLLKNMIRNEDGQILVFVAIAMVAIMGFAAIAIDTGMVAIQKSNLQNAADAAALAGAQELPSESNAEAKAVAFAGKNGLKAVSNGVAKDGDTVKVNAKFGGDSNKIEVVCTRKVNHSFARVLRLTDTNVSARAVAEKSGITSGISGLRPWALVDKYEVKGGTKKNPTSKWVDYKYTYGLEFELKAGGGGGSNGYYGVVAFGDQNANSSAVYQGNITNGYDGTLKIGNPVYDGAGNMNVKQVINALMVKSGDTSGDYTKATKGNSRVVLVPKIDAQSRKVIGFAAIYLKSVDNQGYITANFLYDTTWSEEDQGSHEDWGLKSNVKLSE